MHSKHAPHCIDVEILTVSHDIANLEHQWRGLYRESVSPSPPQGFDFVCRWIDETKESAEGRVVVVTARMHDDLVGLWPVLVRRRWGITWLDVVGFGANEEYAGPLISNRSDASEIALALWRGVSGLGDVVTIMISPSNPVRTVLTARKIKHVRQIRSPVARLTQSPDFDAWMSRKSSSFRKGLRYDRRQIEKLGSVQLIDGCTDETNSRSLIDWMFAEKRAFLARKGRKSEWISSERSTRFLHKLIELSSPATSGVELWALLVNDVPAAGAICLVSAQSIEIFFLVMNPEFAARSPGNLLLEDIARSARSREKDLDFRITTDPYKMRWADDFGAFETWRVASTVRGALPVFAAVLESWRVAFRTWERELIQRAR